MTDTNSSGTPSSLQENLGLLEAETFEIHDYTDFVEELAGTSSCTSTCSSCSSSSGTSCCD